MLEQTSKIKEKLIEEYGKDAFDSMFVINEFGKIDGIETDSITLRGDISPLAIIYGNDNMSDAEVELIVSFIISKLSYITDDKDEETTNESVTNVANCGEPITEDINNNNTKNRNHIIAQLVNIWFSTGEAEIIYENAPELAKQIIDSDGELYYIDKAEAIIKEKGIAANGHDFELDAEGNVVNESETVNEGYSSVNQRIEDKSQINIAIKSEQEAIAMYNTLIKNCNDDEVVARLKEIQSDEEEHLKELNELFETVSKIKIEEKLNKNGNNIYIDDEVKHEEDKHGDKWDIYTAHLDLDSIGTDNIDELGSDWYYLIESQELEYYDKDDAFQLIAKINNHTEQIDFTIYVDSNFDLKTVESVLDSQKFRKWFKDEINNNWSILNIFTVDSEGYIDFDRVKTTYDAGEYYSSFGI